MAIDITSISQLISDFRALSQKDSISPESLGVLLQKLADLIGSAADDGENTRTVLNTLQSSFSELASKVSTLETSVSDNGEWLKRVAEESDNSSQGLADLSENLQVAIDDLDSLQQTVDANINDIDSIKEKTDCPRIAAEVKGGKLLIRNYKYYIDNGYYAYVFRFTSKRNKAKFSIYPDYKRTDKNKGWHVIGGYTKNITFNIFSVAQFRAEDFMNWHWKGTQVIKYSSEAKYLIGAKRSGLNMYVPWGKKKVKVANQNGFYMMRRFRFAIGFGREYNRNYDNLSPAQLASNLAEFSVIFDPVTKDFHFGK